MRPMVESNMFIARLSRMNCMKSFGGFPLHILLVDFSTSQYPDFTHDFHADCIHTFKQFY